MNSDVFKIKVITPYKVFPLIEATELTLQTKNGQITVLKNHAEYISSLDIGTIEVKLLEQVKHYTIGGGLFHYKEDLNVAELIVTSFSSLKDINVNELEKEKDKLNKKLNLSTSELEHKASERELKRALNRISAKNKFES